MRSLLLMDTIQIEVTNACIYNCANCTRFCNHVKKNFFMPLEQVKEAIDSMVGYPKRTGIMGGEANAVHLVTETGVEDWPMLPKSEVAARLAARIAQSFGKSA